MKYQNINKATIKINYRKQKILILKSFLIKMEIRTIIPVNNEN